MASPSAEARREPMLTKDIGEYTSAVDLGMRPQMSELNDDRGLKLIYDFYKNDAGTGPPSQLVNNPFIQPDFKEGLELTAEQRAPDGDGIPMWAIAERIDGMTDLAPAALGKRSLWSKVGFMNRTVCILYVVSLIIMIGSLTFVIIEDVSVFSEQTCLLFACGDGLKNVENASQVLCEANQEEGHEKTCTESFCCEQAGDTRTVKFNSDKDWQNLMGSIAGMLALFPVIAMAFMVLRRQFPLTYACKAPLRARANEMGRRISFKVLYVDFQARLEDPEADRMIQHTGLDGWMLLRFYTLCAQILTNVGFPLIMIFCPLHVVFGEKGWDRVDPLSAFGLNKLDETKLSQKRLFWVHAVAVWVIVYVVGKSLVQAQTRFLAYRYGWLSSLPRPRATTVMVENIPKLYRSDEKLENFFKSIMPSEAVTRSYIVRRPEQYKLNAKLKAYKAAEEKLQLVHAKWAQESCDPEKRPQVNEMERVFRRLGNLAQWKFDSVENDAITKYQNELKEARNIFVRGQQELEKDAADHNKVHVYGRVGFITFSSRKWQALALDRRYRADARQLHCEMPPDPLDVIWSDLASSNRKSVVKAVMGWIFLTLLFVLGLPVFSAIAGFLNGNSMLQSGFPVIEDFGYWLTNTSTGKNVDLLLTGPINPLIFRGLMALVPVFLMYPLQIISHLKTTTNLQLVLQWWFFVYQLVFLIFGAIFGRNLIALWELVSNDPRQVLDEMEATLPQSTNFFLALAVSSWAGVLVHLCRPIALAKYIFFAPVLGQVDAAVRAQTEDPAFFGTGVRMCKGTIQLAMFLIFCLLCPLLSLPLLVYFMIARSVYRYLMLKAEDKRPDTGGMHWVLALEQLWFCLAMFVFLMGYILWIRAAAATSTFAYASGTLVLRKYLEFSNLEWRFLPLEKVVQLDIDADQVLSDLKRGPEYVQDEVKKVEEEHELAQTFNRRATTGTLMRMSLKEDGGYESFANVGSQWSRRWSRSHS